MCSERNGYCYCTAWFCQRLLEACCSFFLRLLHLLSTRGFVRMTKPSLFWSFQLAFLIGQRILPSFLYMWCSTKSGVATWFHRLLRPHARWRCHLRWSLGSSSAPQCSHHPHRNGENTTNVALTTKSLQRLARERFTCRSSLLLVLLRIYLAGWAEPLSVMLMTAGTNET